MNIDDVKEVEVNERGTSETEVENTEVQESKQPKTYSQEELDKLLKEKDEANQKAWNKRWGQEKAKMEMANSKRDELIDLLQKQTQTGSVDELLDLSYKQYKVERPVNTKDLEKLGKADALEILALDEESIVEEANRLADLVERDPREQAKFMEIGKYLSDKKQKQKIEKELEETGITRDIYDSSDFQNVLSKFNDNISLKEVYDYYIATSQSQKDKPFSAGSLKDSGKKQESEYFTRDEFEALTREDLKDRRIFEKAMRSRSRFE